ncbi:MAG: hypothetical protein WD894_26370 [Pirellulales bacterium]
MAKNDFVSKLSRGDLARLLDDIPEKVRLDILQLGLDLLGLVNPFADAASGFISLLRGDLVGAAISAVSVIPVGDVAKLAKFQQYQKSLATLVRLAKNNPRLARALEGTMRQFQDALRGVQGMFGTGDKAPWFKVLDGMRASLDEYFDHLRRLKSIAGHGAATIARRKGRSAGQFAIKRGDKVLSANVDDVVDLLDEAAKGNRHPAVRYDSEALLDEMAMADDWKVTAGAHRKGQPGSNTMDATNHLTVKVGDKSYHLRLDARGQLFQVTDKTGNGIGGVAPWASPGKLIGQS